MIVAADLTRQVGEYGGDLVSPDPSRREATIAFVERMCDLTSRLGSPNTYLRPGSLNPAGEASPPRFASTPSGARW